MKSRANLLVIITALAVALGVGSGFLFAAILPDDPAARADWLKVVGFPGVILLRLLKMLVIPLVAALMVTAIGSAGDIRNAGRLGLRAFLYYISTTGLAVVIGIVLVNAIRPGEAGTATAPAGDLPKALSASRSLLDSLLDVAASLIPDNVVAAAVNTQVLGVITFSLLLGGVLSTMGERGKPALAFFESMREALMKIVYLVVWYAPLGIASLVCARIAGAPEAFWQSDLPRLGWYMATVLAGLALHVFVVLPLIFWAVTRRNPFAFLLGVSQALLTAFSTASSAATLPLTIEGCRKNNGVSDRVAGFVLPLGATINMDGTALYEAVAVVFIAQSLGIELSPAQMVIVFLTATLAAMGAAPIPEAGLVMMAIVLTAVGIDPSHAALILAVDWLLDRFRTAVNVAGDAFGAGIIDQLERKEQALPAPA